MDIDTVWRRIINHQGETFHQKRGKPFTYTVHGKSLLPETTRQHIPKLHSGRALDLMPLQDPVPLQDLRGTSYIYAIVADPRTCAEAGLDPAQSLLKKTAAGHTGKD